MSLSQRERTAVIDRKSQCGTDSLSPITPVDAEHAASSCPETHSNGTGLLFFAMSQVTPCQQQTIPLLHATHRFGLLGVEDLKDTLA